MYSLINALQFVVTMVIWKISFGNTLRIILFQLRKVVLGEFFDDMDIGNTLADFFDIPVSKQSEDNVSE